MKDCFPKGTQTIISIMEKSNKKKKVKYCLVPLSRKHLLLQTCVIAPSLGGPRNTFPFPPAPLCAVAGLV